MVDEALKGNITPGDTAPDIMLDKNGEIVKPERTFIPGYEKKIATIIDKLTWIGIVCIIGMLGCTVFDIIVRVSINWALPGAYEYSKLLMLFVGAVALPYTALNNGHVEVDLLVRRLPRVVRKIFFMLNFVVVMVYCAFITWQNWAQASVVKGMMLRSGDTPFILLLYPFYYVVSIGFALLFIVVFMKTINYIKGVD